MARILFVVFSGGGNLPPSMGIARALMARGHAVTFAGDPEMMPRMRPTPFRALELTEAYAQLDHYPAMPLAPVACYLTSPAVEAQLRGVLESEDPDFVLVDFMFFAAVHQVMRSGRPRAVMAHMAFHRVLDAFRGIAADFNAMRTGAGFDTLPSFDQLLLSGERVIVTSLGAIDRASRANAGAGNVCHVGPVLDMEAHASPLRLPWTSAQVKPLILVSFSTDPVQADPGLIQRALDALADLDVYVVATIGGGVEPGKLSAPANALVVDAADHDDLMAKAALVISHGGHGTTMRALKHGVPLLVMPGFVPDQAPNGAMVAEFGAGRVLAQQADVATIRAAAHDLIAEPGYRARASEVARLFAESDSAATAADEVEALLASAQARVGVPREAARRAHG